MLGEAPVSKHGEACTRRGRYRCPHCRYHWTDYVRDVAVSRGEWLAEQPDPGARRIGFWLPAILSSAVSLSEVAAARLAAEASDDPDLPPRVLPADSVALTAGIDMQTRGFSYLLCAWTARLDCAIVDYGRLYDWADVEAFLGRVYPVEDNPDGEAQPWPGT